MSDDRTSKESKKKKASPSAGSDGNKADASEGAPRKGSRKKTSTSKRPSRSASLKKSASAGTPVAESPKRADVAALTRENKEPQQTTVRRVERRKSTVRGGKHSASSNSEQKVVKKRGGSEYHVKMSQEEYDKWCEAECEMWTPVGVHMELSKNKFIIPALRLFAKGTKPEDVPVAPAGAVLAELQERTKKGNQGKSSVRSKKKLRRYKTQDDKFTKKKE